MDKIVVRGGKKLNGEVVVSGAKNSALPLLFSTLLAKGEHRFKNVPKLKDIDSTALLLRELGAEVFWDTNNEDEDEDEEFVVRMPDLKNFIADYDIVRKMRASILCLGPLLARYGEAVVSLPGGCAIGTRPIDQHLEGFKALGAEIEINAGNVRARRGNDEDSESMRRLAGGVVLFDGVTVGGTENVMMAAALAKGQTVIENAAKEPEIVDLANYLNKMGAKITGAGTGIISIEGVDKLTPSPETIHKVIPDRIEAGTLLIAGAITGGEVTISHCAADDLDALLRKMEESGFKLETKRSIEGKGDCITVFANESWKGVDIATSAHPGFPTDLQAQFMALMTQAEGVSIISETIFENRFMHVQELMRLNADITPRSRVAVVRGCGIRDEESLLKGAPVMATDLRASACLVLAGLVAEGETVIARIYHLDRGYEKLEEKLAALGADIERVS